LKKSQVTQVNNLAAQVPSTFPPQNVPANFQQYLPPFLPLLIPSLGSLVAYGQTPSSLTLAPPGSRPHFLNSQQFIFIIPPVNFSLSENIIVVGTCSAYVALPQRLTASQVLD